MTKLMIPNIFSVFFVFFY